MVETGHHWHELFEFRTCLILHQNPAVHERCSSLPLMPSLRCQILQSQRYRESFLLTLIFFSASMVVSVMSHQNLKLDMMTLFIITDVQVVIVVRVLDRLRGHDLPGNGIAVRRGQE